MQMMVYLVLAGVAIFFAAPLLGRLMMRGRDPVALVRVLQLVGVILMVAALLIRPYNRETTAVPPPPDLPVGGQ
jgi:uncharacterized membrane protein YdcZ (DUF606 family)